jgi:hypothetical protein
MPSYITKIVNNGGICVQPQQKQSCCSSFSRDSSKFFSDLAAKLLEMTTAINKRIEDIKKNCGGKAQSGFLLASVEAPVMNLGVKYEYIEYIKRFGPPIEGKFDEKKLEQLRIELGIDTNSATAL